MTSVTSHHNANGLLRVYINGAIHMAWNTTQMANMQAWRDERRPALYSIEVTPKEGMPLLCEYDREDLWREVLGEIDKAFGPPPPGSAPRCGNPASRTGDGSD